MKKFILLVMFIALIGFTGCSSSSDNKDTNTTDANITTADLNITVVDENLTDVNVTVVDENLTDANITVIDINQSFDTVEILSYTVDLSLPFDSGNKDINVSFSTNISISNDSFIVIKNFVDELDYELVSNLVIIDGNITREISLVLEYNDMNYISVMNLYDANDPLPSKLSYSILIEDIIFSELSVLISSLSSNTKAILLNDNSYQNLDYSIVFSDSQLVFTDLNLSIVDMENATAKIIVSSNEFILSSVNLLDVGNSVFESIDFNPYIPELLLDGNTIQTVSDNKTFSGDLLTTLYVTENNESDNKVIVNGIPLIEPSIGLSVGDTVIVVKDFNGTISAD
ncbi:hypothetical protein ACFLY2_02530 [Patescibacteria group bacterium]